VKIFISERYILILFLPFYQLFSLDVNKFHFRQKASIFAAKIILAYLLQAPISLRKAIFKPFLTGGYLTPSRTLKTHSGPF